MSKSLGVLVGRWQAFTELEKSLVVEINRLKGAMPGENCAEEFKQQRNLLMAQSNYVHFLLDIIKRKSSEAKRQVEEF